MASEINIWQVLATGVSAAVITQGLSFVKDFFSNRKDEHYSSLLVIATLERYVVACAHYAADLINYVEADNSGDTFSGSIADRPVFTTPDKANWKLIDVKIADRIFYFDVKNSMASSKVKAATDYLASSDVAALEAKEIAKLSLEAWGLARELRDIVGLPAVETNFDGWDIIQFLTSTTLKDG